MILPPLSFRARVLAIVLVVAVGPLLILGLWLTGQSVRSGERLLVDRLAGVLDETAATVERRWIPYRSALLDLVEGEEVRAALGDPARPGPPAGLASRVGSLDGAVVAVVVRDAADREVWVFDRSPPPSSHLFSRPLTVRLPFHGVDGHRLGTIEARILFAALQGAPSELPAGGAVLAARDPRTGAVLLPVPFDPTLVGESRFGWNERTWIGPTREVAEPRVTLAAAAPLTPFVGPFEEAARRSLWILVAVAGLGVLAAAALTRRLTASLEELAATARAVAAGDLTRKVRVGSRDEVGQVGRAFDTMVASLRRTLRQLAERESLAAVNEFAGSLAHEIRNPLTSVQLDLQQVEERLPPGSPLRTLQEGAIEELRRLDRTVAGALETARSGRVEPRRTNLLAPVRAAIRRAAPRIEARSARLEGPRREEPVLLHGDPDALEQLVLNLLLNAAEAVAAGGEVSVAVEMDGPEATVTVRDDGRGMPEEERARIFEPFFTTRPGGTGLGLAVARRIVLAHRGSIDVRSATGRGTTVIVRLPRADGSFGATAGEEERDEPTSREKG